MKLSIIIPAYNEQICLPKTLAAIDSALEKIHFPNEIIVVDNESTDKTAQIARGFGDAVVSETEHNIAKVRNSGANFATGDVLIFIDADTLVPETLFQKIADRMKDENCFGGAVAVDYGEFKRKWMRFYLRGWQFWGTLFNMKQGAAQFCRKSVFEELKGYDATIYMGEDVIFYWRLSKFARRKNATLFYIETPKVTTSPRRFDEMNLWKTFLLTHPLFILLAKKKEKFWRDWYEKLTR